MTCRIAIACSDHTLDEYVLVPVIELAMKAIGKPKARVKPIRDPRIQGDSEYFRRTCELLARYGPIADAVVFVVDVDCDDGRDGSPHRVEKMRAVLDRCESPYRGKAVVVGAIHEAEVWATWGSRSELGVAWSVVRADCHPKERFFNPLLTPSDHDLPDKGRARLTQQSLAAGWESIKSGCPELGDLEREILAAIS